MECYRNILEKEGGRIFKKTINIKMDYLTIYRFQRGWMAYLENGYDQQ